MHTSSAPPAYHSMPSSAPSATKKHDKYYYEDGNLVLQAGDTLFPCLGRHDSPSRHRFPSAQRRKAHIRREPACSRGRSECRFRTTIVDPLSTCPGPMPCLDLCRLDCHSRIGHEVFTIRCPGLGDPGTWQSFRLTLWRKIALQQTYTIDRKWAGDAFIALCTRAPALEIEEGKKLGIEMTVQVAGAREKLDKWGRKKPEEVKKVVAEVWGITVETPAA
ncbi:hypothetical protein MIND_00953300 [Mycena indigotica]|uniref:Uncharacterized protein n=1 Tax=Mycena indigotica TaxID=2126181 RepID=A0A8H6SDZ2_9AGAR|nr:uncharacterized protein MIND_00953300 [Mycena indigotica]KAF7297202.1 hypothetical protein MIND_00953300 [Mycena indigotica]